MDFMEIEIPIDISWKYLTNILRNIAWFAAIPSIIASIRIISSLSRSSSSSCFSLSFFFLFRSPLQLSHNNFKYFTLAEAFKEMMKHCEVENLNKKEENMQFQIELDVDRCEQSFHSLVFLPFAQRITCCNWVPILKRGWSLLIRLKRLRTMFHRLCPKWELAVNDDMRDNTLLDLLRL